MNKDFDAIENISLRIVSVESFLACNLGIGMIILYIVIIHYNGERTSHNFLINDCHYLSFGKDANQLFYLLVCPKNVTPV